MKKTKKLLALVLAILMVLPLVACGGNNGHNSNADVKLDIVAADFGYGISWLEAIAKVYMSNNPNVSIKVHKTPIPHQLLSNIEGGLTTYDIFFGTSGPMVDKGEKGVFVNLDDLYASVVENGQTLADKLGTIAPYMGYNGHYYAVPYVASNVGMVVNHDTMRALYGENYTLPNTTDEFLALGKDIKKKGAYPFIDTSNYTDYLIETWWVQYDPTGYANYWNGLYVDENGETKQALKGESMNQPGKLAALELADTLLNAKHGYNHQYADRMDLQQGQLAFIGEGYGEIDTRKVAFVANGSWLENELEMILGEFPADLTMFRVPVISSIINVLPDKSVADDAELSALITAIDAGSTALTGTGYEVTQNDFDRVRNARFTVAQNSTSHTAAITSCCKNIDAAKDFLRFMATDEASAIAARVLKGVSLPFSYIPSEGNGYEISKYVASANALTQNAIYIGHPQTKLTFNGLSITKLVGSNLCTTMRNNLMSGEEIYYDDVLYYTNEWQFVIGAVK